MHRFDAFVAFCTTKGRPFAERQATLAWQAGYGVVSFGTRDLDWVRNYVRNHEKIGTGSGGPAKNA
jgi:hypothetical protein